MLLLSERQSLFYKDYSSFQYQTGSEQSSTLGFDFPHFNVWIDIIDDFILLGKGVGIVKNILIIPIDLFLDMGGVVALAV